MREDSGMTINQAHTAFDESRARRRAAAANKANWSTLRRLAEAEKAAWDKYVQMLENDHKSRGAGGTFDPPKRPL